MYYSKVECERGFSFGIEDSHRHPFTERAGQSLYKSHMYILQIRIAWYALKVKCIESHIIHMSEKEEEERER